MILHVLIADEKVNELDCLRCEIHRLAEQKDFSYQLYVVKKCRAWHSIPLSEMSSMEIAVISMDYPEAFDLSKTIYEANPFCRLIFCARGHRDVVSFLPSRPVAYLDICSARQKIGDFLSTQIDGILRDAGFFRYSDRYRSIMIPYSAVLYFYSRDRAVFCKTLSGEEGPLRRTVDDIAEETEPDMFIRCHKSFLVIRDKCRTYDKSVKMIRLINGEEIPVSRAYWKSVEEIFAKK